MQGGEATSLLLFSLGDVCQLSRWGVQARTAAARNSGNLGKMQRWTLRWRAVSVRGARERNGSEPSILHNILVALFAVPSSICESKRWETKQNPAVRRLKQETDASVSLWSRVFFFFPSERKIGTQVLQVIQAICNLPSGRILNPLWRKVSARASVVLHT